MNQQNDSTLDDDGLWKDDPGMMSTYTRRRINPLTMTPDDVDIRDIARALTMQCRYNGHVGRFYSVAEHCMRVAELVETDLQLSALLHDAAEAYLGDLIRPLKHTDFGKGYLAAEEHVERTIMQAFGLPFPIPAEVMEADRRVLTEVELAGDERRWQEDGYDPHPRLIEVERDFLFRFRKYSAGRSLLIGLSGYARSGKDTLASFLVEEHGFTRVAFADIMREGLLALNPWVRSLENGAVMELREMIEGSEFYSGIGWERAKTETPDVRPLMQRFGTEFGRHLLGENVWVDATMDKLLEGRRYVITDVRFPNEYEAIKRAGGEVVRLTREGTEPVNPHPSETALDTYRFDRVFHLADDPDGHLRALSTLAADLVDLVRAAKVGV